ncbi:hypothetical protein [Falsiroseomonas sp. CW058]|uniref:hypothetical protein n=1 Tax=Falsiroseomonas sp. CW058 TaxID=3388664 RepID=UPI003D316E2E
MTNSSRCATARHAVLLLAAMAAAPPTASAQHRSEDVRVSEIAIRDNSAWMNFTDVGWLSTTSGRVGPVTRPRIAAGDQVTVSGQTVVANVIVATRHLADLRLPDGSILRAGSITCVAAQSERDLPGNGERSRRWIYVRNCQPLQ